MDDLVVAASVLVGVPVGVSFVRGFVEWRRRGEGSFAEFLARFVVSAARSVLDMFV